MSVTQIDKAGWDLEEYLKSDPFLRSFKKIMTEPHQNMVIIPRKMPNDQFSDCEVPIEHHRVAVPVSKEMGYNIQNEGTSFESLVREPNNNNVVYKYLVEKVIIPKVRNNLDKYNRLCRVKGSDGLVKTLDYLANNYQNDNYHITTLFVSTALFHRLDYHLGRIAVYDKEERSTSLRYANLKVYQLDLLGNDEMLVVPFGAGINLVTHPDSIRVEYVEDYTADSREGNQSLIFTFELGLMVNDNNPALLVYTGVDDWWKEPDDVGFVDTGYIPYMVDLLESR